MVLCLVRWVWCLLLCSCRLLSVPRWLLMVPTVVGRLRPPWHLITILVEPLAVLTVVMLDITLLINVPVRPPRVAMSLSTPIPGWQAKLLT